MSVAETIASLPYLSKQEILMRLSAEIGKAEEAKRTIELVLSLSTGIPQDIDVPGYREAVQKGNDALKQINDSLLMSRSVVHHLTYERQTA